MSDIRHQQMQEQMTIALNELRAQVATEMIEILDRISKRPRAPGDKTLPNLAGESHRLNRDDSGSIVLGSAFGIPGLGKMMNIALDVGAELYGSRKSTLARPQDKKPMGAKQKSHILQRNKQDLMLFSSLGQKLDLLDTYEKSGYKRVAIVQGSLLPLDEAPSPVMKPKYKADNHNNKDPDAYTIQGNTLKGPMPKFA